MDAFRDMALFPNRYRGRAASAFAFVRPAAIHCSETLDWWLADRAWWITRQGSITLHARRHRGVDARPRARHCSLLAHTPVSCRVKCLSVCQRKCSNAPRADWFCSETSTHIEHTNINVQNAFLIPRRACVRAATTLAQSVARRGVSTLRSPPLPSWITPLLPRRPQRGGVRKYTHFPTPSLSFLRASLPFQRQRDTVK